MDWNKEKKSLIEGAERNWLKLTPGRHEILFLSDGEEYTIEWEGETVNKVRFKVKVNDVLYDWGITKGVTQNSLYGQLVLVAASGNGLDGRKVHLIVRGSGKETVYTVEESIPLMKVKEEKVK
jgi:hypothetical protein